MTINKFFQWTPPPRHRRKFRGRRRHFGSVLQKARAFSVDLDESDWFEFWHYHADWKGRGNRGWRSRRHYLQALCTVFQTTVAAASLLRKPHQVWLTLHEKDSGQDAVYVHTPNPNRPSFPCKLQGAEWGQRELEAILQTYLTALPIRVGTVEDEDGRVYFAYAVGRGEPPELAADAAPAGGNVFKAVVKLRPLEGAADLPGTQSFIQSKCFIPAVTEESAMERLRRRLAVDRLDLLEIESLAEYASSLWDNDRPGVDQALESDEVIYGDFPLWGKYSYVPVPRSGDRTAL
ncbi:MAG: hypothetical protein V1792_07675 [Pseudomonadota bacterium]